MARVEPRGQLPWHYPISRCFSGGVLSSPFICLLASESSARSSGPSSLTMTSSTSVTGSDLLPHVREERQEIGALRVGCGFVGVVRTPSVAARPHPSSLGRPRRTRAVLRPWAGVDVLQGRLRVDDPPGWIIPPVAGIRRGSAVVAFTISVARISWRRASSCRMWLRIFMSGFDVPAIDHVKRNARYAWACASTDAMRGAE